MAVYLDNAATSYPKPEAVYSSMDSFARSVGASPGRGGYGLSIEAARLLFDTRELLAQLFSLPDSSRLVITHSATESLNLAIRGLLKPGDHVVTTSMEHNSLARPLYVASQGGVLVSQVTGDSSGEVSADNIFAALTGNTRLVAMTHCSNVTGAVNAVAEIGHELKKRGIMLLVDAAQSAGSLPIDIPAMNIDLLAAPGHKGLLGAQGTGILYVADGISMEPLLFGGTGSSSSELAMPQGLPERYESGTHNMVGIAGLNAGIKHILSTGVDVICRHESQLVERLIDGLQTIDGVRVINPDCTRPRGAVVSFTFDGLDPSAIGHLLDVQYEIAVRTGLHCAPLAHKTIGTFPEGTVRVSPGLFNTVEDIDLILYALSEIRKTGV